MLGANTVADGFQNLPATLWVTVVYWLVSEANVAAACIFHRHSSGGRCGFPTLSANVVTVQWRRYFP